MQPPPLTTLFQITPLQSASGLRGQEHSLPGSHLTWNRPDLQTQHLLPLLVEVGNCSRLEPLGRKASWELEPGPLEPRKRWDEQAAGSQ